MRTKVSKGFALFPAGRSVEPEEQSGLHKIKERKAGIVMNPTLKGLCSWPTQILVLHKNTHLTLGHSHLYNNAIISVSRYHLRLGFGLGSSPICQRTQCVVIRDDTTWLRINATSPQRPVWLRTRKHYLNYLYKKYPEHMHALMWHTLSLVDYLRQHRWSRPRWLPVWGWVTASLLLSVIWVRAQQKDFPHLQLERR